MKRRHRGIKRSSYLRELWQFNPKCFYCGCQTVLPNKIKRLPNGDAPPEMATREHLFSRFDSRRWDENNPYRNKIVLSCYKCNKERSEKETAQIPAHLRQKKLPEWSESFKIVPYYPPGALDKLKMIGIFV